MIEHVKDQRENCGNFWTTSFKKLLLSTEDDKKMRVVSKILRKALGGFDADKIQHTRYDSFPKEKFRRKNNARRSLMLNQNSTPKKVEYIENNPTPQLNNQPELYNAHIYETIKKSRPEMIEITKNERNNLINSILTSNTTPATVAHKIELFEELSRTSSSHSVSTGLDTFFSDELGNLPSPILKCKGRTELEKKFVVNCYESRTTTGPQEVIKRRMGSGDIVLISDGAEVDNGDNEVYYANVGDCLEGDGRTLDAVLKKPNRVTHSSILRAMEEIELMHGMDLIVELNRRATVLENHREQLYSYEVIPSSKSDDEEEPLYATPNKSQKSNRNSGDSNNNCNDTFFKLKQDADIQCKIMKQAAKALEVYRGGQCRGFADVRSEVEAEKILLTASCKYDLLLQEIRLNHYELPQKSSGIGSVIVRDLEVELKPRKEVQWFVCIISDEENVVCSKAVQVPADANLVTFDEVFSFDNLDAGFKLKAEIFSFKQNRHPKRKSSKLNKRVNKLSRKLLYKDLQTYSLVESSIPDTAFVREGNLYLTVSEITSQTKDWKLEVQPESQLTGKCDVAANIINVQVDVEKMGFLTVGSENNCGINWNRRWCVLRGTVLNFWNYPNEDCNPPMGSIDLRSCKYEITNAKRSFCPKPKTLLLEGVEDEVVFLNADSISEMHDWRNKLNKAYSALKGWNLLKVQLGTDV